MKVLIIDTDQFLSNLIGAEQQRDTSETARILREMGLITGECNCNHCVAERSAMDAQEGDELVSAFIRGFNFKATEGATTEAPKSQRLAMLPMARPRDIYSAISQANGHPAITQEKWEAEPQSVHNFYEHVARFMNEALAAR